MSISVTRTRARRAVTTVTSTFIFDLDGQHFRVSCLACGWRAEATSWKAAARLERRHRCVPAEARHA